MSRAEEVRKLRENGMSIDEICLWFGAYERDQRHEVVRICRKAGMPITEDEKKISKQRQTEQFAHDEAWAMAYIREKSHGRFEYVSGYKNMDSTVLVRCTYTGEVLHRSMITFRVDSKLSKAKRRARMAEAIVDKDINLDRLIKRDKGICYICGKKCNREDIRLEGGYWMVGDSYPSIDHVKPLAKGGNHSWENVRLAHYICNVKKNDRWEE